MKYLLSTLKTIIAFAIFVLVALMGFAGPVQAELLENTWYPFEFLVEQDPNNPCGDEPFFLAQGMQHFKVANLREGGVALNFNAQGTFTGLNSGVEAHWRHNVADVLPIIGETTVYSYQDTLKIIGQGGNPSYFAKV